jgi:outer membrane protein assembly factor BamD
MRKILLLLVIFALSACTTPTGPSEAYQGQTPGEIYKYGKTALQEKNYSEAIKRFEALDVQYPFGTQTESAQLYLIYAYYMKEDYALSISAADRFIRLHPANPQVDYAYFMRGLANFYQNLGIIERVFTIDLATRDITQLEKAFADFSMVVNRFPDSVYAAPADQYLIYLRNMLANHELHVANFYYGRKAYVAAADRASDVVAHYQGAPAVANALNLLANAYQQLGMKTLEQQTLKLMHYNGYTFHQL